MNALALKYFGVNLNGDYTNNKEEIVSYRCPYSGELITDLSTTHLDHILPVSSNGGTVLFNCIPVLDKVNLSKCDESNILTWWLKQDYFSYDKLERLIQYMFEAYSLFLKGPTEEELSNYNNSPNNDNYIENDDLSIDLKDKLNKKINIDNQPKITYFQFINSLIDELSKNRDASKYISQLNTLKEQNIFGSIEEIEILNKTLQNVFFEMIKITPKEELKELFKQCSTKQFTTYKKDESGNYVVDKEYGEINSFWINNKDNTIIPQLFFSEKYANSDYDIARQNIMNYLNSNRRKKNLPEFKTINEYIDTLDKTKKEVKNLIKLRGSLLSKKEQLIIENEELKKEINTIYRRVI